MKLLDLLNNVWDGFEKSEPEFKKRPKIEYKKRPEPEFKKRPEPERKHRPYTPKIGPQ